MQVRAFCDHIELLIRARVYVVGGPAIHHGDLPVLHDLESHGTRASLRLEDGLECYPLAALDNLVSTYDKWYNLYKLMRKTITV